mmetsp:Transcript_63457/g.147882  ORF Transcript_63457/g.147882 Transcript_63457/m.147882 type:complete len:260 (+) Transcript_63457:77-856(+)
MVFAVLTATLFACTLGLKTSFSKRDTPKNIEDFGDDSGENFVPIAQVAALPERISRMLKPSVCNCTPDVWRQYSICKEVAARATLALSFGIGGFDPWAEHVVSTYNLVPNLFDCFDQRKPAFESRFWGICVGSEDGVFNGKNFTKLTWILKAAFHGPALVKMNIERSELGVLENLADKDWARIGMLHVVYHLNSGTCNDTGAMVEKVAGVMGIVRRHMAIVNASAAYWGTDCQVNGVSVPKIIQVSYKAKSLCAFNSTE